MAYATPPRSVTRRKRGIWRCCSCALLLVVVAACSDSTLPADVVAYGTPATDPSGQPSETAIGNASGPTTGVGAVEGDGTDATDVNATGPDADDATTRSGRNSGGGADQQRTDNQNPGQSSEPAGGTTAVGVTADSIALTVSGFFSGLDGAFVEKMYDNGFLTWVNEVNDEGGIHGRKIIVKKIDNKFTSEGGVAACKEAASNGTLMTFIMAGFDSEAFCLDDAGVPGLSLNVETDPAPWRVMRGVGSMPGSGATLASFAKTELDAAGKKVGLIVANHPLFMPAGKHFQAKAKELGLDVVAREVVASGQSSFVPETTRMRNAGAQVVAVIGGTEILGILRDAKAIGYEPTWTGFGWAVDEVSQAGQGLMRGIKALGQFATVDSPAYQAFRKEASRQGKSGVNTTDAGGYGGGVLIGHILESAGPNLTRESLVAAIDQTRFDPGVLPPVAWAPPDRIGSRARFPVVCCHPDGTWKALGPARESF